MAEEEKIDRDTTGSVFGNLPDSRPGSRSPRRDAGKRSRTKAPAGAERQAKRTSPPKPPQKPPRRTAAGSEAPPAAEPGPGGEAPRPEAGATHGSQIGGVEDLAWAGVAVAAEAATLGVRLAGRAFEAMRDAVERR